MIVSVRRTFGSPFPCARLTELLWDSSPPAAARGAIHTYVGRLRRTLARHSVLILTRGDGYLVERAGHVIDAARFTDLAHRAVAELDPTQRPRRLDEALALWRGPLLADLAETGCVSASVPASPTPAWPARSCSPRTA